MPIHADWMPLYQSLMEQYCDGSSEETSPKGGVCPKGEQVFYALCKKQGWDYTKPKPKEMEAFQWAGDLIPEEREGRYFIRGKAIHPCKTYHPNEWPEVRVYLEEELKASAQTLSDKPLLLDHFIVLDAPNRVLKTSWEDGAVEYVAEVSKPIYDLVKGGEIRNVSIEYDWRVLEKMDGIAPRGLELTGLSLLRRMQPGDPEASVEVWEGIVKKLKEMRKMSKNQLWEGVWDRAYINDLPDSAFAIILPGGEKENGKTVPRTLRKFPHHRADGSLDLPHLRNANARVPQSDLSDAQKARAMAHLNQHKKSQNIGQAGEEEAIKRLQEQAGEVPPEQIGEVPEVPEQLEVAPEPTLDEVIQAVEDALEQLNISIDRINQNFAALSNQPPSEETEAIIKHIKETTNLTEEDVKKKIEEIDQKIRVLSPSPSPEVQSQMNTLYVEKYAYEDVLRDLIAQRIKQESQRTLADLTRERDELKAQVARLNMGEGVLEPGVKPALTLNEFVSAVEAELPRMFYGGWGPGANTMVRRLKTLVQHAKEALPEA